MAETFAAFHTNVREALTVHSQQVAIEQPLLGSLVIAKLAFVCLGRSGGRKRRRDGRGRFLLLVVLETVREQHRLLVELFTAGLAFERSFVAERMHLHVVVQTCFFVGGEFAVRALVLFATQHVLVVVASVALEEAAGFEFLTAQHAGVDGQRLSIRTDDDRWREMRGDRKG